MKKKIEFKTNKAEPYAVYNFYKEILEEYGNGVDVNNLRVFKKEQKKHNVTEYYGTEKCGFKNTFSRDIEMGVAYIVNAEYRSFGLKDKNRIDTDREFYTSVWSQNEMHVVMKIKGTPEFIEFCEDHIERHFHIQDSDIPE
jgi:hypothetical protein